MATREQLITALQRADEAGNVEDARALAQAIADMDKSPQKAPQQADSFQGTSYLKNLANLGAQGATMGASDELGAMIAQPAVYALKNLLPESMGGEDVTYDQAGQLVDMARGNVESERKQFQTENPVASTAAMMAGGLPMMMGTAGLANAAAPKATAALANFATRNPYATTFGLGGVQGELYGIGTGEGDLGTRAAEAVPDAISAAVLSPAMLFAGRNVVAPVARKTGSALAALGRKSGVIPATKEAVGETAETLAQRSSITNKPMPKVPAKTAGKIRMPEGVRKKSAELLRVEEDARQGLLGQDAQRRMNEVYQNMDDDVRGVMQSLMGKRTGDSKDILVNSVETFRKAGAAAKKKAQALYDARDEAMATAIFNRKKVAPSLGTAMNKVLNGTKTRAGFKSKSGAPAKELYNDFLTKIKGRGDELPFEDLAAWRADVSSLAGTDKSTAGYLAKQMLSAFDDWMADIKPDMLKSGDPKVAELARAAGQSWKQYKTLFSPDTRIGNSPVLKNITEQYAKTPEQFVDKAFGKSMKGLSDTAQIIDGMLAPLDDAAQASMKDDIFGGMMARAFENATKKGGMKYSALRDSLYDMMNSGAYKKHLSTPERDKALKTLWQELSDFVEQTGRTDVRSPSGGHMGRILKAIGHIPVVGRIPSEIGIKGLEASSNVKSRITFDRAMKEYAKSFKDAAKGKKLSDVIFAPLPTATTGAIIDQNRPE